MRGRVASLQWCHCYAKALWNSSLLKKRICNLKVYHVGCKNFWESGNFPEEAGPIPSRHACRQCSEVWGLHLQSSPGFHLGTSPGELHWIGGPQAWGVCSTAGASQSLESQPGDVIKETQLLWLLWSQKSQLTLKTLNKTPIMDSYASRNLLLLVPQKIVFQIWDDSKKLYVCLCSCWGDWTERKWTEFLDKESLPALIM